MIKIFIFVPLLVSSFTVLSHNIPEALQQCSLEKNGVRRLACFDKVSQGFTPHVKQHPVETPTSNKPVVASQQVSQPVQPPLEPKKVIQNESDKNDFGLEHKTKLAKDSADKIYAKIISIKKDPYKKYLLTLDNGHTWKQTDSTRIRLRLEDIVVISRGALNSFFMDKKDSNQRIRVKRLK